MKGYLNNQEATTNSITPDGWFKTGDIAVRDKEGYWYIVDRRKELIKYKVSSTVDVCVFSYANGVVLPRSCRVSKYRLQNSKRCS